MFPLRAPGSAACVVVLALAGVPAALRAETLADAIALAYDSNPTLQSQRAQLRALDETYVQARAGWRPTATGQIGIEYSKAPQTSLFGGVQEVESNNGQGILQLTQPLYTGGKTAAEVRATNADILAGRQTLRQTEGALLLNVVTAYADVLRDQKLLKIREADFLILQSEVDDARARLAAGEVTRTDLAQTETQLASDRTSLSAAQGQLQISRSNYATFVGQNPGELAPLPPLPNLPATVDQAFDVAEQESATIKQAQLTENASHARVAEARAANRATVNFTTDLSYSGVAAPLYPKNYDRSFTASVIVTQPILTGGVNSSNIRRALELNNSDRISIELARRNVVQSVSQSWNNMITARASVGSEASHVDAARRYFAGTQAEYTVGQRSTLDIIVAEESLSAAQVNLANVEHDAYVGGAQVLNAIGRLELHYLVKDAPLYDPATSFRRVANSGGVPWENVIGAIDNLGAPVPNAAKPLTAPLPPASPITILPAGDTLPEHPAPATASPTAPFPATTSPDTPEVLGSRVGASEDSAVNLPRMSNPS